MRVLVTGGAGFIASHIVDELVNEGHDVAVVDNLSTGVSAHLNPQALFYQTDISDDRMADLFAGFKPETVIHHAAQIDVRTSVHQPVFDARENILGSVRILELCKDYNVKKIIYASSAAVYGVPVHLGIREDHPVKPANQYGVSKYVPEQYIRLYSELYGLDYTILRYANVYGERQNAKGEAGVVSIFIDQLLGGRTPVIYGDGEQTRDFVYVKDIVAANIAALIKGSRAVVNVGTNVRTSVLELLHILCGHLGLPPAPRFEVQRAGDIQHSCLDYTHAAEKLDWTPRYALKEGLRRTLDYCITQNRKQAG